MGAEPFSGYHAGADLQTVFTAAQEAAAWEHGHSGYTGTIAEKSEVALRNAPLPRADAEAFAEHDRDQNGRWGPAFAVPVLADGSATEIAGYILYGWASS